VEVDEREFAGVCFNMLNYWCPAYVTREKTVVFILIKQRA